MWFEVLSKRTKNSRLDRDYLCSFTFLGSSQLSSLSNPKHIDEKHVDTASTEDTGINNAYFALSRILDQNAIPHNPISSPNGLPTIFLHGRNRPSTSLNLSPLLSTPPLSPPQNDFHRESFDEDQIYPDKIKESSPDFRIVSRPKMASGASLRVFTYSWTESSQLQSYHIKDSNSKRIVIRLEIFGRS